MNYITKKLNKNINIHNNKLLNWNSFNFKVKEGKMLTDNIINNSIKSFWNTCVSEIEEDQHLICLFKIKTTDGFIYTIGRMIKLNKDDKQYFVNIVKSNLDLFADDYKTKFNSLVEVIINFGIKSGKIESDNIHYLAQKQNITDAENKVQMQYYNKYKLPITMIPFKYGTLIDFNKLTNTYYIQITSNTIAKINCVSTNNNNNKNIVEIIKEGNVILKYIDSQVKHNSFIRTIGIKSYLYSNCGDLALYQVSKPTKFIKKVNVDKKINNNFLTLDLETCVSLSKHIPYAACTYDGKKNNSFYLTDYKSVEEMLSDCIKSICRYKYNFWIVYIHNFANFDGIFLLKILIKLGRVEITINNDKIIQLNFYYKLHNSNNEIVLKFRDSYQILISSLSKLADFVMIDNSKVKKGIFPYNFVNDTFTGSCLNTPGAVDFDKNALNYIGNIPEIKFFENLETNEYSDYCNNFTANNELWDLRKETLKYCENDCFVLYEVLKNFNTIYFSLFKININSHPTLPSHAMRLFKSIFIEKDEIPMIYGNDYKILKLSYTGGATDMYIPMNNMNEKVYGYDVNSLYPYIMSKFPMPVGEIKYFEGDIRKNNPDAFGFFYCEITVPENLEHPILQTHIKTKSGLRTVAPIGKYCDLIFSPSMDNASNFGYKFDIKWGYTFEKKIIFKEYVEKLYNLRLNFPISDPMNYIAKLLLNSLYGKFGQKNEFNLTKVLNSDDFNKFIDNFDDQNIKYVSQIDDNYIVEYENKLDEITADSKDYNINVAVASAISSYARDYMSQFKNNSNLKLFYTDTDSIFTNLNPNQMNDLFPGIVSPTGLGKLKLESESKNAVFISAKCYCLETIDGKVIYKFKGLKKKVSLNIEDFKNLLDKNYLLKKSHTKWFKSLSNGEISVLTQSFTLQKTDNKRQLIYNDENTLIATKPYKINKDKLIIK